MPTLKTVQVVRLFAVNCMDWLYAENRLETMNYCGANLSVSLRSFSKYLEGFFNQVVRPRIGTDSELDLGHYQLSSNADKKYVAVRKSKNRLPTTPSGYIDWVDWDIPRNANTVGAGCTCVGTIYKSRMYCFGSPVGDAILSHRLPQIHISVLSQVLVQSLFAITKGVNLGDKPLPDREVRCRFGNYEMLYDHLMQEWRIWMKS